MKINFDIDLTPEEARKLMGLPDLEPMQKAILTKVQNKMEESIEQMTDPEMYFKTFMPVGVQAMDQFQKFFSAVASSAARSGSPNKKREEKD